MTIIFVIFWRFQMRRKRESKRPPPTGPNATGPPTAGRQPTGPQPNGPQPTGHPPTGRLLTGRLPIGQSPTAQSQTGRRAQPARKAGKMNLLLSLRLVGIRSFTKSDEPIAQFSISFHVPTPKKTCSQDSREEGISSHEPNGKQSGRK